MRKTLLTEGPGRPNVIATIFGHVPTVHSSYAAGGGLSLVKSFDPVVLFATANYRHTFSRDFADVTRLEPEERFDVTLGYALALNDTLTISTSVSALFSGETTFTNATLLRQDVYSLQLGLTSWLARGLYIEPTVSFGLSGPGNSVAFGVTLPYTFLAAKQPVGFAVVHVGGREVSPHAFRNAAFEFGGGVGDVRRVVLRVQQGVEVAARRFAVELGGCGQRLPRR